MWWKQQKETSNAHIFLMFNELHKLSITMSPRVWIRSSIHTITIREMYSTEPNNFISISHRFHRAVSNLQSSSTSLYYVDPGILTRTATVLKGIQ